MTLTILFRAYAALLLLLLYLLGFGERAGYDYAMKLVVSAIMAAPIFCIALYRPFWGLRLYLAAVWPLLLYENHEYISTFFMNGVALGLSILFLAKPAHRKPGLGVGVLWLFLFLSCSQYFFSQDLVIATKVIVNLIVFMCLVYWIAPRIGHHESRVLVGDFVGGGLLLLIVLFVTYDLNGSQRLGESLLLNPNGVGLMISLMVLLPLYRFLEEGGRMRTMVYFLLLLVGLSLTGSRAATLSVVVGILAILSFYHWKWFVSASLGVVVFIGLVLGFDLYLDQQNAALVHLFKSLGDGALFRSDGIRLELLVRGWELFQEQPVTGHGLANYRIEAQVGKFMDSRLLVAHNMFVSTAVELGILGPLLVVSWLFAMSIHAVANRSGLTLAMVILFTIQALTHGNFFNFVYAVALALALSQSPPVRLLRESLLLGESKSEKIEVPMFSR